MRRSFQIAESELPEVDWDVPSDLIQNALEARSFLLRQPWCQAVGEIWFDVGNSKHSVYLCEVSSESARGPYVWVINGDLPPDVVFAAEDGIDALKQYITRKMEWVETTKEGVRRSSEAIYYRDSSELMEPTRETAEMLETRLTFIRDRVLPDLEEEYRELIRDHP